MFPQRHLLIFNRFVGVTLGGLPLIYKLYQYFGYSMSVQKIPHLVPRKLCCVRPHGNFPSSNGNKEQPSAKLLGSCPVLLLRNRSNLSSRPLRNPSSPRRWLQVGYDCSSSQYRSQEMLWWDGLSGKGNETQAQEIPNIRHLSQQDLVPPNCLSEYLSKLPLRLPPYTIGRVCTIRFRYRSQEMLGWDRL